MAKIILDMTDEMNDDWLRARRLKKKKDKKSQTELDRRENTKLVPIEGVKKKKRR